MINVEKSKQFFEQLRGNGNPTAQEIRNAIAATGDVTEITTVISSYAKGMGIDVKSELNELTQARETAMQEKAVYETAVSLAEKSEALVAETDKKKQWELIKGLCEDTINQLTDIIPHKNIGIPFSELLKKQFPQEPWFVDNLIGPGLTVLTGASKVGKSWAALSLATALDQGSLFMGKLKAEQCDTLYLALEDTEKRIQERLLKQGNNAAFNGSLLETTRCTLPALRSFLKANPNFRVVIIDTLQRMMSMDDLNDYTQTVGSLSQLKAIADDLKIAIVVIHHNRKGGNSDTDHMESALGSTGINATADCTLTMRRPRGADEATLYATGRDVEDISYTISFNREFCTWSIIEQGALKPALTKAEQQIIDLLEGEKRNWTTGEIAKKLDKTPQTISGQAGKLENLGLIDRPKAGHWCIKGGFGDSAPLKETESSNVEVNAETSPGLLFPNKTAKTDTAA
jgi:hypothetical protein